MGAGPAHIYARTLLTHSLYRDHLLNSAHMKPCYNPSASASSHASSLVRAVLRTPTPSPAAADPSADCPQTIVADPTTPPSIPVYHLYGLDSSTVADSVFEEKSAEPGSRHLERIALFIPVSAMCFPQGMGLDAMTQSFVSIYVASLWVF